MKCVNCGNSDSRLLFDEGDTVYCSECHHRTNRITGKDDLITCPFCGRLRDRKAMYCWWCNNTLDTVPGPTLEEYKRINQSLKKLDESITPENKIYWKIRNYIKEFPIK